MLLLLFAFLSGLVTILAPCIWPLLPIVLSSSTLSGHRRPLGISLGVILSFAVFTLSVSYLVAIFHFNADILRFAAVVIIGVLGVIMIVPQFLKVLEGAVSRLSSRFGSQSGKSSGFLGGFLTGLSLGIIWSPCAGPILATIATLSATRAVTSQTVLVTLAYSLGVGIPLFAFSSLGSALFQKSKLLNRYLGRIQQVFGIIMILTAVAIFTNYDKTIETGLLNLLPSYSNLLTSFETTAPVTQQLNNLKTQSNASANLGGDQSPLVGNPAPDFTGGTQWLNLPSSAQSVSMKDLKGKVVLVDFWTYTCINCIRTLPFVTSWYDKYHDKGFIVVGVHTPEFQFEHNTQNVENAIKQFNIHYPVVQDNNYTIWNSYSNEYWPAEYLIDANGIVRRAHFGEGEYDVGERAIQELLKEKGTKVASSTIDMPDQTPKSQLTPETYVGSHRRKAVQFASSEGVNGGLQTFSIPQSLSQDQFAFGGKWNVGSEMAEAYSGSSLEFEVNADKVFLVITPATSSDTITVSLDGKPVNGSNSGVDVHNGVLKTDTPRLYNLIDLHGNQGVHRLKLEFQTDGTLLYAFTFG